MNQTMELRENARHLRRRILELSFEGGSGHIGSNLSLVEILLVLSEATTFASGHSLVRGERDALVLSKGHAALALYLTLGRANALPEDELRLTWHRDGSRFCEHAHAGVPGVDVSTGSLGHGLSVAAGLALGLKTAKRRAVAILGDGECGAGQIWEAAAFASSASLHNLVAIVDANGWQALGPSEELLSSRLPEKFRAFGWECREIDGHDLSAITQALAPTDRPLAIVARTIKGKGVSFIEGSLEWHYRRLTAEELSRAKQEIDRA